MALDPTPQRQRVLSFVSPDVGDLLFYETVDVQRVGDTNVPPYGTPHPDYKKWPDHKLVLISASDANSDRQGRYFRYYYAAERQNQDEYNFECGSSQIGGLTVNTVTRTYITLRSSFDPNAAVLEIGSAMPNVPEGKFTGSWVLYDSDQKRIGNQELDSLFVVEQRVYIQPNVATGATYGEIVTTEDTIASVVPDTEDVETGIDIISSQVTPIGNGQAIKVTKAVRDGWPDPVQIATGSPPEGLPPTLYRDNLRSTTVTRKVSTIPPTITLTGDEIGKTYKRETPDRVEEEVTTLTFDVYDGLLEQSINRTAYLRTTRETVASSTGELPLVGDGTSDLLYRSGDITIYRNTTVTTEGVAGLKGTDTAAQAWGSISETTNYTLDSTPIAGGSTRLIFKDSMTAVYEATSVSVTTGGSTLSSNAQPWGVITKTGEYDTAPDTGLGKDSRQVWSNGVISVYLNETDDITVNGTTTSSNAQSWGVLRKNGVYSETEDAGLGKDTRLVWTNGVDKVYLNETDDVTVNGSTKDTDPLSWGSVTWNGAFSTTSSGTRSRQVWSNGVTKVYLNENPTLNISGGSFTSGIENNALFTETETTSYGTTASASGTNSRSRLIYSLAGYQVFENVTITVTPKGSRTYPSVMQFEVPSILTGIAFRSFPLRSGGADNAFEAQITEGRSGSFPCTVTEYYTETPTGASGDVNPFKPKSVSFATPFGGLKIGPTLHGNLSFDYSTGTQDPRYKYTTGTVNISATTPTTYAGMLVTAGYSTTPYRNGFIVKEYKIQL
jgi:hypothetical protein